MKFAFPLLLLFALLAGCDTNEKVLHELSKHNITGELLTRNLKDADALHAFTLKSVMVNGDEKKVTESTFDPKKEIGQRWTLVSVDGESPTPADHREFDRTHNTKRRDINGEVDKNSWEIIKNDEDSLIISFRYDKRSLPHKYAFLGECRGIAFFNKQTGHLEKAEFVNEKPLKIKLLNVHRLDMIVYFEYQEEEGHYLIKSEELDMDVSLLGQLVPIRENNDYFNYQLVK